MALLLPTSQRGGSQEGHRAPGCAGTAQGKDAGGVTGAMPFSSTTPQDGLMPDVSPNPSRSLKQLGRAPAFEHQVQERCHKLWPLTAPCPCAPVQGPVASSHPNALPTLRHPRDFPQHLQHPTQYPAARRGMPHKPHPPPDHGGCSRLAQAGVELGTGGSVPGTLLPRSRGSPSAVHS